MAKLSTILSQRSSSVGRNFKNLIINGAMNIAQRSTSVAGITSGDTYNTVDRWTLTSGSMGTQTMSVENDAPTGSGFKKSLKILCTTGDPSPASSDQLRINQYIEGQNLQSIRKGSSSAQKLTLSFWVKSNKTGTYITRIQDYDNSRHVAASYSISASATWEYKTVTFPADTTGAFDSDEQASLALVFYLGAGSQYSSGTLATSWEAINDANMAVGQTNLAALNNNYWQITGIQLELGNAATEYEFKPYAQELQECQRYYQIIGVTSGSDFPLGRTNASTYRMIGATFVNPMRPTPTATIYYDRDNAAITTAGASQVTTTSAWTDVGATGGFVDVHAVVAVSEL